MFAPLVALRIASCYKSAASEPIDLPNRMSRATPDMKAALLGIGADVRAAGGRFQLSDLFRSYEMQLQAHLDFTSGKKGAFSPPPGGSMHEGGRAFDVDLGALGFGLEQFWEIAARHGVVPIIPRPDPRAKEAWHFECRGSHQRVYDYYAAGKASNMKPGAAMGASAILAAGLRVDAFGQGQKAAYIQSGLIRLGYDVGAIDGALGPKSREALAALGLPQTEEALEGVTRALQQQFPQEFFDRSAEPEIAIEAPPERQPTIIAAPVDIAPTTPVSQPPPSVNSAPSAPEAPPQKPLARSRTIWAAVVAAGAAIVQAFQSGLDQIRLWLKPLNLPFDAAWLVLGIVLLALAIVIYARIDDRLRRKR